MFEKTVALPTPIAVATAASPCYLPVMRAGLPTTFACGLWLLAVVAVSAGAPWAAVGMAVGAAALSII